MLASQAEGPSAYRTFSVLDPGSIADTDLSCRSIEDGLGIGSGS